MKRAVIFLALVASLIWLATFKAPAPQIQGRPTPTIYQRVFLGTNASTNTLRAFLLAYYKMEDGSGVNKADATGNGFTLIPRATFPDNVVVGKIGNADNAGAAGSGGGFQANATNLMWDSSNGYPGVAAGNSGTASGKDFTINFWYSPSAGMTGGGQILGENNSATTAKGYTVYTPDNLHFGVTAVGQTSPLLTTTSGSILINVNLGVYTMITFGWDHSTGSKGSLFVYTNGVSAGVFDGNASGNPWGCLHAIAKFTLLNYEDFALGPCNETTRQGIDEIGCWGRKLNANEVKLLYNNGSAIRPAGI